MRFISLDALVAQSRAAAVRFPMVLLSAVIAAIAGIALVDDADERMWVRVLLSALLGLPLFTALVTTAERAGWSRRVSLTVQAATALLLVGLWFMLGRWTESIQAMRFGHLVVLAHLLVAILPFAGTNLSRAFWQYNRLIFLRFLTGALFAGVLFAGLAIALVAIDKLFNVNVDDEWYARLWVVIALVFHPWFVLGGLPRDLPALEQRDDYPQVLKVFSQFILIPVVCVYMVILTAYLVRVVLTRTWPSGWIGWLVASVSAAGTLALLLVHPVRQRTDSRWVDAYGRWFFIALLPSVGMLLVAVWLRVDQYGFTERRYFLAVLALWLAAIALYYGISASRDIRIIPTSLAAIALVTFVGPWSAYSVSRRAQVSRLRGMLVAQGLLTDSGIRRAPATVPFATRREISGVVRYLIDAHGPGSLATISEEIRQVAEHPPANRPDRPPSDSVARAVMGLLGLTYVSQWQQEEAERTTYFSSDPLHPLRIDGYEWMSRANLATTFRVDLAGDTIHFAPDSQPARLILTRRGSRILEVPLGPLLDSARKALGSDSLTRDGMPRVAGPPPAPSGRPAPSGPPPLLVDAEGGGVRLRLVVHNLTVVGDSTGAKVRSADATILLRLAR